MNIYRCFPKKMRVVIAVKNLCDSNQSNFNILKRPKFQSPEDQRTKTTVKADKTFSRIVRYLKAE